VLDKCKKSGERGGESPSNLDRFSVQEAPLEKREVSERGGGARTTPFARPNVGLERIERKKKISVTLRQAKV